MIYFRYHLIVMAVVSLAASPAAFADAPLHKASGGGSAPIPDVEIESYGFQAQIDADGDVKGKAVFQFRPPGSAVFRRHHVPACQRERGLAGWRAD
jgi:hypothetical protein